MHSSRKLKLKPGFTVFFCMVWFKEKVATVGTGLGLTDMIYPFAIAKDEASAEALLRERYEGQSNLPEIRRIDVRPSRNQDINCFVDPEKMAGYREGVVS